MAEWFKAAVLKTVVRETVPGVRIPLPPPTSSSFGLAECQRNMVNVSIDDEQAVFEVEGFDKVWALRSLVFWDVHDPEETIIISLDHERYKKLIIQVDDPAETEARLRAAIGKN
jgi:hypothetical protein